MNIFEAIILGMVQGFTEFLPVSSSGHLQLGHTVLGLAEESLLFDVLVHVGTVVAVLFVFWKDLRAVLAGFFKALLEAVAQRNPDAFKNNPYAILGVLIVIGTIPTALVGLFLGGYLTGITAAPAAVGVALLLNSVLLLSTRYSIRRNRTRVFPGAALFSHLGRTEGVANDVDGVDVAGRTPGMMSVSGRIVLWGILVALIMGVGQGLAVTRGISRSGTTIAIALVLGLGREDAARFSFLLAIPAIMGALVLELSQEGLSALTHAQGGVVVHLAGFLTAVVTGYVALRLLLGILRKGGLHHFAIYCSLLGIAAILFSLMYIP